MKIKLLLFITFLLLIAVEAFALPRFSLRQNDRCIDCHVNPSGGLVRNESGWYFGKNIVSMISPRDKDFAQSPKIADNIILGFDIRSQYLYSAELNKTDFQNMSGAMYAAVSLSKKIDVVGKYDFVNDVYEGYGIARILPNNSYIKFGAFTPNYGLRIDDHTAYTRGGDFASLSQQSSAKGLVYDPYYTETGLEVGAYLDNFAYLSASVGKSNYNYTFKTDPTYTFRAEFNPAIGKMGTMFGASYSSLSVNSFPSQRGTLYGFFAGLGYDKFALMGEVDFAKNLDTDLTMEMESQFVMVKAAYRIMVGLDAIVRYDMIEPNKDVDKDELSRLIAGVEFFPYSFIEVRPQYRLNFEDGDVNNDAFVLQFHIWY